MICPNCNETEHEPNAKFCHVCGAELSGLISSMLRDIKAIDLGLPSGTKWANMNIGASRPEDTGSYFALGFCRIIRRVLISPTERRESLGFRLAL